MRLVPSGLRKSPWAQSTPESSSPTITPWPVKPLLPSQSPGSPTRRRGALVEALPRSLSSWGVGRSDR